MTASGSWLADNVCSFVEVMVSCCPWATAEVSSQMVETTCRFTLQSHRTNSPPDVNGYIRKENS